MTELILKRTTFTGKSTIGNMDVGGINLSTLELPADKCIPKGRYKIRLDVVSPKFGNSDPYKKLANGRVPRLENVRGREGILIHVGNYPKDTQGCILLGLSAGTDYISQSIMAYTHFWKTLVSVADPNNIYITIE